HLRRARLRRRRLHAGRARRVPGGPGHGSLREGRRHLDRGGRDCCRGGREVTTVTKDPRDVILAPVVSEKSYGLLDEGKYTFVVDPQANKTEIKIAVEQIFSVKVASVNTINRKGKTRRTRFGLGKRKDTKRAIVTLREGTIDIFGLADESRSRKDRHGNHQVQADDDRPSGLEPPRTH